MFYLKYNVSNDNKFVFVKVLCFDKAVVISVCEKYSKKLIEFLDSLDKFDDVSNLLVPTVTFSGNVSFKFNL